MIKALFALTLLLATSACSGSGGGYGDSVWNSYDYRHPVPRGGADELYDNYGYEDNDRSYTPPRDFGCDPDNIHMCE